MADVYLVSGPLSGWLIVQQAGWHEPGCRGWRLWVRQPRTWRPVTPGRPGKGGRPGRRHWAGGLGRALGFCSGVGGARIQYNKGETMDALYTRWHYMHGFTKLHKQNLTSDILIKICAFNGTGNITTVLPMPTIMSHTHCFPSKNKEPLMLTLNLTPAQQLNKPKHCSHANVQNSVNTVCH